MAEKPSTVKDFIYANLPYLLLIGLAFPLLLTEQQIGLDLASRFNVRERQGLAFGMATQRTIALLALVYAARKIWLGLRR